MNEQNNQVPPAQPATPLTLIYDGLLSQIQQICATQQRRTQETDRQIIAAIEDICASRLETAVTKSNELADIAHDLDEQKAATQGMGTFLVTVRDRLDKHSVDAFDHQIVKEIDDLLSDDVISRVLEENDEIRDRLAHLEALINTPELINFVQGAVSEAAHQRNRWGSAHDANKQMGDWVAVFVHLLAKFVNSNWNHDIDKSLHHLITVAAVAANAHAQLVKTKLARLDPAPETRPSASG